MRILIAEQNTELANIWARHLTRKGAEVIHVCDRDNAILALADTPVTIIVLGLEHADSEAVADYAAYRHPQTKVVFVTGSTFFSDGSVFEQFANACACLPARTPPEDLVHLVEYHAHSAA